MPISSSHPSFLSAVLVVRDDVKALPEWIEYHCLIGVEKFYLYDTTRRNDTLRVLAHYIMEGVVELIDWQSDIANNSAHLHALSYVRGKSTWIAFMEAEEFLVSPDGAALHTLLREFEAHPSLNLYCCRLNNNSAEDHSASAKFILQPELCHSLDSAQVFNPYAANDFSTNVIFSDILLDFVPQLNERMAEHRTRYAAIADIPLLEKDIALLRKTTPSVVRAKLEEIENHYIEGWALDLATPHEPLDIVLKIDDEVIANRCAGNYVAQIAQELEIDGYKGFRVSIPTKFQDGQMHQVALWIPDRLWVLERTFAIPATTQESIAA